MHTGHTSFPSNLISMDKELCCSPLLFLLYSAVQLFCRQVPCLRLQNALTRNESLLCFGFVV